MTIQISERPLVTIALFAYNEGRFVGEAVESVLAQTYSPLEIILSDDCSSDGTFEIMREIAARYRGPHRLVLNRNPTNLGAGHLNRVLEMACGEFIVQAEGDDISMPDRTEKLVNRWLERSRSVDLVCSYFAEINEDSQLTGYVKESVMFVPNPESDVQTWRCGATGATASYTRKLYEKFGPISTQVLAVDWVLPFRAWLEGGIELVKEPLVKHRTHANSISYMVRNLNTLGSREARFQLRRRVEAGSLATAEEWLKAWKIARGGMRPGVERALERMIRLRRARLDAFDAKLSQLPNIVRSVLQLGGPKEALRLCVRHVLKVY